MTPTFTHTDSVAVKHSADQYGATASKSPGGEVDV